MEADQRLRLSLALHSSNQRVKSLRFSAQHATIFTSCNGLRHMATQPIHGEGARGLYSALRRPVLITEHCKLVSLSCESFNDTSLLL